MLSSFDIFVNFVWSSKVIPVVAETFHFFFKVVFLWRLSSFEICKHLFGYIVSNLGKILSDVAEIFPLLYLTTKPGCQVGEWFVQIIMPSVAVSCMLRLARIHQVWNSKSVAITLSSLNDMQ